MVSVNALTCVECHQAERLEDFTVCLACFGARQTRVASAPAALAAGLYIRNDVKCPECDNDRAINFWNRERTATRPSCTYCGAWCDYE